MALAIPVCETCGHASFPPRLACPRCHGSAWRQGSAAGGVIEHVTVVRRSAVIDTAAGAPRIGLVRTDLGPLVLARLDAHGQPGSRVELSSEGRAVLAGTLGVVAG